MSINIDGHLHCDYLDVLRLPVLTKTIKQAKKQLKESGLEFDSIAFCGMSGALVAPALAVALKKKLIMVRKVTDKTHSSYTIEGFTLSKKYLFVDDFVASGQTFKFVHKQIKEYFAHEAKCVGIFEYREFDLSVKTFRGKPLNQIEKPQSSKSDSHGLTTPVGIVLSSAFVVDLTSPTSDDGDDIPF